MSRDFLATLPTTLPWERNAGIEYITELAAPMTETGPFYTDVEAGDIVYYNPMDSITIIYAPTSSVPTLTKMGEVTSDLAAFENLPGQRRHAHRAPVGRRYRGRIRSIGLPALATRLRAPSANSSLPSAPHD